MKNVFTNRRVGTLTVGVVLVASGVCGILHLIDPSFMNWNYYIQWWPVILILLGAEVLLAWALNKGDKLRYDGWAVVLMIVMLVFAGLMAATELALDHVEFFDYFF